MCATAEEMIKVLETVKGYGIFEFIGLLVREGDISQ
jgi:hypothetical protein